MPAIVEIGRGHAFHAGKLDGGSEQTRAFHANTDNAEANAVTRRDRPAGRVGGLFEKSRTANKGSSRNTRSCLQKHTP